MSDKTRPPIARTHYFSGESLLTDDFICEQQYNMEMLSLLNSSLRTWGIANGLEVVWKAGSQSNQVTVSAGMAIDRLGRQIVLTNAQVLKLDGVPAGSTVYLTIRYHEVYANYSDESGVAGYKRIVQQPILEWLRTLQEPGINILLAVVNFSSQGGIDSLAFKLGHYERRYVGSRLGVLELVTEGSGIQSQSDVVAEADAWSGIQFKALKESSGSADYMDVLAGRSQFSGMLTTRDNLGVGVDQPQANLQVERVTSKGVGKLTTLKTLLKLQTPIYPPLQPGDTVTPILPVGAAPLNPQQATIKDATSDPCQYNLVQAFQEDLLLPCPYTYVRKTLVRFSAGAVGDLFRIDGDGSVGLGAQSAVQTADAGAAALSISAKRQVGIALDTHREPKATLEVNGGLLADSLSCNGLVKAQSFEGNGSKLQNLPILSYWTKQDPTAPYSAIYYKDGNVGVQMSNPPASLSVGTGLSFIGAGYVSADGSDSKNTQLIGTQTAFKSQVSVGDSIQLGQLIEQWRQVKTIISDMQLELTDQFPTIIRQSSFQYAPQGSDSIPSQAVQIVSTSAPTPTPTPTPGTGTVSSDGAMITGVATQFSKELKAGDWMVIPHFVPQKVGDNQSKWLVEVVTADTTLTVINKAGTPIPANVSAYMVTPSLMGMFQSNAEASGTPPVPAMLLVSNGTGDPKLQPNTVAINVPLSDVDSTYSLQVDGDVNFGGDSTFDHLIANTLVVKQSASIASLTAGPDVAKPLLSVTQNNVVIGAGSGSSLLEIGGDAHATGNLIATAQLQGASASVTGTISGGSLSAKAMNVSGVAIDTNGNVGLFGTRVPITVNTSNNNPTGVANTDGYIVASMGTVDPHFKTQFAGMLMCTTSSGGSTTSVNYASASTTPISVSAGKKGTQLYYLPQFGTLCVPVRKGELWSLQFVTETQWLPAPNVQAFWMPLGPSNSPPSGTFSVPETPQPVTASNAPASTDAVTQSIEALRQRMATGGIYQPALAEAQQAIDQRVNDLTQILGDATKMPDDANVRADFVQRLQKIVCAAAPISTTPGNRVDPQNIADLIDTFARITGRQFSSTQKALLDSGVRALITINDNDANRSDINLIRNNINLFLQHLQNVINTTFDNGQLRLLTRALVRLVGSGTQDPSQVNGDAPG